MNPEYFSIQIEADGPRRRHYRVGRRCIICGATLSMYNPSNRCFCHSERSTYRVSRVDSRRKRK